MHKLTRIVLAALVFALLVGCGGSSGPGAFVSRLVVGYVYVTGNAGTGSPDMIISPNSTPPDGYFAPTAGTVTIAVTNGTITRAPDSENFSMAASNAVVAAVRQNVAPFQFTVSATSVALDGTSKSFSASAVGMGTPVDNDTTLAMNIGAPSYTAGPPAAIEMLLRDRNGDPGSSTNPFTDPETATVGMFFSGNSYDTAVVVSDEDGTAISGLTITVTSSDPTLVVAAGMLLTPVTGTGVAAGPVTITVGVTTASGLTGEFTGDFDYGTATNMAVAAAASTLEWEEDGGGAGVVNSTTVTGTLTNQYGAPIPGATVNWTDPAKVTGTDWNAPVGGTAFDVISNVTGNDGMTPAVTFSTPVPADGVLPGANKFPKGDSNVTATSGAASGFDTVTITRPLGSLTITGPSRVDIGNVTPATGSQSYQLTGAVDVDLDAVTPPSGAQNWAVANMQFADPVGNTGDSSLGSTAASSIGLTTGILTAGGVAGQTDVTCTIGTTVSNVISTQVFGVPSKIVFTPDTLVSAIPGALGEYLFGTVGQQQVFSFVLQDSAGHSVPLGEYAGFNSVATIQALTGGSITAGGTDVSAFTITCGTVDGLFTITTSGTWSGLFGGVGSINLSRDTGQNAP